MDSHHSYSLESWDRKNVTRGVLAPRPEIGELFEVGLGVAKEEGCHGARYFIPVGNGTKVDCDHSEGVSAEPEHQRIIMG